MVPPAAACVSLRVPMPNSPPYRTGLATRAAGERGRASSLGSLHAAADELEDDSFVDHLSPGMKRAFGIIMSLVSGALYGSNFTPPQVRACGVRHSRSEPLCRHTPPASPAHASFPPSHHHE